MRRRALATWAVAACGCSFESIEIRLRDAALELAPPAEDVAGHDGAPDVAPSGQRSCAPPVAGCGQARIVGGRFTMGDPMAYDNGGTGGRAVPVQPNITVSTFMLDRYEVTVARFRTFVRAMALSAGAGFDEGTGSSYCNWTTLRADREGQPMNCVEWQTAQDFCRWDSGGTLPSEAQWEYAARGSTNRPWPWGGPDSAAPDSRVCWNRSSPTLLGTCLEEDPSYAMGATPAPESIWHLVGNVWEWTSDLYAPYSDVTCWNGLARTDPVCTMNADGNRSVRGGSWDYVGASNVRSGSRYGYPPAVRSFIVGFRCAGTAR